MQGSLVGHPSSYSVLSGRRNANTTVELKNRKRRWVLT
jgi:hypothetical protein